jgi:hypothetical protein
MKSSQSATLPSKHRVFQLIAVFAVGYLFLEYIGAFTVRDLTSGTKAFVTRAGIVVTYISALVTGLTFYWDRKAERIAFWAEQQKQMAAANNALLNKLSTEVQRDFEAQKAWNTSVVQDMENEIQGTLQYSTTKPWLGWLAITGLVFGTYLQLLGSA